MLFPTAHTTSKDSTNSTSVKSLPPVEEVKGGDGDTAEDFAEMALTLSAVTPMPVHGSEGPSDNLAGLKDSISAVLALPEVERSAREERLVASATHTLTLTERQVTRL